MRRKPCNGIMGWHDDGDAFMCRTCGHVVLRTRMNPMPDTTHERRRKHQTADVIREMGKSKRTKRREARGK